VESDWLLVLPRHIPENFAKDVCSVLFSFCAAKKISQHSLSKEANVSFHLITGGTGFIGSAIILELLRQTDVKVIGIVRPGTKTANERLWDVLENAGRAYNYDPCVLRAIKERCRALPGDLNDKHCGIARDLPHITQFWHCAASLRYEDRYQSEIYATNVVGTLHALDLARHLGISKSFNYISTAYVAGQRTGIIPEQLMTENWTHNHYEASKVEAEAIVAKTMDFPTRILRPSIVIGHSRTFSVVNSFSGMYGFMRKLLQFKGAMSRVQAGLLSREPVQMRVDANALLNLVPVDLVARQAVRIAFSSSQKRIFHLTNATPPTAAEFLSLLFQDIEMKQPVLTKSRENFSWIDKKLDQGIDFYSSYLIGSKIFDRQNTDAVVGNDSERTLEFDPPTMRAYFHWYLDLLCATRPVLLAIR
jgi:nucleoside-diphosphate-sugar epimerase